MDIKIAMITFDFPKERMMESDKAYCFIVGSLDNGINYWIPKCKVNITNSDIKEHLKITVPKWIFEKSPLKPFVSTTSEDVIFKY